MADHVLRDAGTKPVTINGTEYRMQVGNMTLALDIEEWLEALRDAGEGDGMGRFRALAERGRAMVASAFGEGAADDLLGGSHRLDLVRMVQLLRIIAEEMDADSAMEQIGAALEFADTSSATSSRLRASTTSTRSSTCPATYASPCWC